MNKFLLSLAFVITVSTLQAQVVLDTAYIRTINERAAKIVDKLGLADTAQFGVVRDIIANQYKSLRMIHDTRNDRIKALKTDSLLSKEMKDSLRKYHENEALSKLYKLHFEYLSKLLLELSPEQIEMVKDGMTSGKVKFTFDNYPKMIPSLTERQKRQIYIWLVEARELAMDAESSDKKTEVFGKYKGRIANYLAKEGYDLKREGEQWKQRMKVEEAAAKDTTKK